MDANNAADRREATGVAYESSLARSPAAWLRACALKGLSPLFSSLGSAQYDVGGVWAMSRREERAIRCEAEDLVADAEAMLHGRVMNRPCWDHRLLGWVSVNTLAHGDWPSLSQLADGKLASRNPAWDASLAFLAAELLAGAETPEGLVVTQRAQLIPLELNMLAGGLAVPWTASDLVKLVLPHIDGSATRRRRPDAGRSH
jgi:hypothetical protein